MKIKIRTFIENVYLEIIQMVTIELISLFLSIISAATPK